MRYLCASRIARIHGDERADGADDANIVAHKVKARLLGAQRLQNGHDLVGHDRQHLNRNAVEPARVGRWGKATGRGIGTEIRDSVCVNGLLIEQDVNFLLVYVIIC